MSGDFDTHEAINEADAYVRDHLLIQWMIEYKEKYLFDRTSPIEDIYEDWTRWLKERGEAHG